jgi:glycosyltransferase involved in cell wall biosynthesis
MKILFLVRLFYPHVGGVEKHVMEVTKKLEGLGHEITIITEMLPGSQAQLSAISSAPDINATIYRIPVGTEEKRKKFIIWKWLWQHQELLKNADVIHAHDVFFWYLPFRFRYPRKKVFTTFHGYESYPIRKKAVRYRKVFEQLSHGTICVGEFMKKWYGADPDYVIYGGATRYQHALKKAKHPTAVFIGRLDDQTGIETYGKAVAKIREAYAASLTLTVYGDGPYRKKIADSPGIILKGFDPHAAEQLPAFHYAFISRYLAILEALVNKIPVIAVYDNPLKKDYLEMTPFASYIAIAETVDDVVSVMKEMYLNPNRTQKMIEAGSRWAEKQTWEAVTSVYLKLLKK